MSLQYSNLDQVKVDYMSINGVTESFRKLIQNDNDLINSITNKPETWEKRWYNDDSVPGYQQGAAIWLNTDTVDDIIDNRFVDIQQYVFDSRYYGEYQRISSDNQEVRRLFKDICLGQNGYDMLFYLGDINLPAQVRVSIVDNNKELPTVTSAWIDAFRLSSVESYTSEIHKNETKIQDVNLSNHIAEYHISSMTMSKLTSTYVLNDFSNISRYQQVLTHSKRVRPSQITGFEFVKLFVKKPFNGMWRWFRLWNSGFLEHGGTVQCPGGSSVSVDLVWSYGDGRSSLGYDYQSTFSNIYSGQESIYVGDEAQPQVQPLLGEEMTYDIVATPVVASGQELSGITFQVFNIANDSFTLANPGSTAALVSYHTAGFVTKSTINKAGL